MDNVISQNTLNRIAELEAELARLREDKARLEWLLLYATSEQQSTIRALAAGKVEIMLALIDQARGR
jgi:hypothetical protein